jgi:hypothetical protein
MRRTSVGAKVLIFGFAIFAVLGSFWGIVWFIRSYVEPPRVMLPAPMTLASTESKPVALAKPTLTPVIDTANAAQEPARPAEPTPPTASQTPAAPATEPVARNTAETAPAAPAQADALADRWAPMNQFTSPPPQAAAPLTPPAAPAEAAPPARIEPATAPAAAESASEDVAEGSVPAIEGPAPLPRRKPLVTASARRTSEPPLPRPRPDGQVAPQSVWTAVPSSDDRYQASQ